MNVQRPPLFLFIYPLTTGQRPVRACCENVVCTPPLQVDALAPLLIVRGSGTMKLTLDRPATGRIILGVGALVYLPFVKADVGQCIAEWEWVRSRLFLV